MIINEIITAFIVSIITSGLFAIATRKGIRRKGFIWLLLFLFVGVWAGGIWLKPFGPSIGGVHWLPFLAVGLILAVILMLLETGKPPQGRHETLEKLEQIEQGNKLQEATYITLSIFFWLIFGVLVLTIMLRYLLQRS